eukprot:5911665-Amphidinium_carterae.1
MATNARSLENSEIGNAQQLSESPSACKIGPKGAPATSASRQDLAKRNRLNFTALHVLWPVALAT